MRAASMRRERRFGFTLVEVMLAVGVLGILSVGLIASGRAAWRMAEYTRIAGEARCVAKETMEEMTAAGRTKIALGFPGMMIKTNISSLSVPLVSRVQVYWHQASGAVGTASTNAYAEVHVSVEFRSPFTRQTTSTMLAGLIR